MDLPDPGSPALQADSLPTELRGDLYILICKENYDKIKKTFPCGSSGKESTCNAGNLGWIPGLGRSPGEGKGYPLQYSGVENSMDYSPWGHKESDMTERLSHAEKL